MKKSFLATYVIGTLLLPMTSLANEANIQEEKPNMLIIWGDDIGYSNISAYNNGLMGYETPNIDRIADEGAIFTHHYAQQSCTAGRASFITGLLTIGMPGSEHGIPDWARQLLMF